MRIPAAIDLGDINYSVTEISAGAFRGNTDITGVVIPATVREVGDEAFADCTGMIAMLIHDDENDLPFGTDALRDVPVEVMYYGRTCTPSPFAGKLSLQTLGIGKDIDKVDDSEFAGCTAIMRVFAFNPVPPAITDACFEPGVYDVAPLTVADECVDEYKAAEGWRNFNTILGASEIRVSSINIRRAEVNIMAGKSEQLIAYITPDNATNKKLEWSSDNEAVASVDADGNVTGVALGTAIITATTTDGSNLSTSCKVTVTTRREMVGNLMVEVVPGANGSDDTVMIIGGSPDSDGNLEIPAEVEIDGKKYPVTEIADGAFKGCSGITGVMVLCPEPPAMGAGAFDREVYDRTTLRVPDESIDDYKAADGWKGFFKIIDVNEVEVDAISPNITAVTLEEDMSEQLTATVTPDNATDKTVAWTTSDATVATVDATGKVTAAGTGTATITATTANGLTATCTVTVIARTITASSITLNARDITIDEGSSAVLTATVTPDDTTDKSVTWSSSDVTIATVDATGKVTAVAAGTATITATTANGLTATCTVTVNAKTAIGGIGADSVAVRVEGCDIVAPRGSEVFDITGRRVNSHGLRSGIYIVRLPGGSAVKVYVN